LNTSDRKRVSPVLRTIPSGLSFARLIVGAAYPWLPSGWQIVALPFAAFTDLADGALSRRLGVASTFGRILDPVADKVFILAVLATLLADDSVRPWQIIVIGLRDWAVLAGCGWILIKRDWAAFTTMTPTILGKLTTVAQFAFLSYLVSTRRSFLPLTAAVMILSGLAAADYLRCFRATRQD
jgi:cardiolipin synthase (CMP-forming)